MNESRLIQVRGAREHNLKSIDVDLPRDRLIVVTGLSGSGKSTLAMDTIYAEGQRRYVESLSTYARQFLNMMEKPDVDHISGLSPAISIEQKTTSATPRSTVGTVTEIFDYLRLLYARVGTPISPATGLPIVAQQVSDMVNRLLDLPEGTRVTLLAPVVRDRKGEYRKELLEYRKKGFVRVRIDGDYHELDDPPELKKNFRHTIEIVVDRIVTGKGIAQRLADSLRTALDAADGLATADYSERDGASGTLIFSEKFACPVSGFTIAEIEPRLFSFNVPAGACPGCDGLGTQSYFDKDLVIPDPDRIVSSDAVEPWRGTFSEYHGQTLDCLAKHYGESVHRRWRDLSAGFQQVLLYGSGDTEINFVYQEFKREYSVTKRFEGVLPNLERRYHETESAYVRESLERFRRTRKCEQCSGHRLRPEALAVKLDGLNIGELTDLSVWRAREWIVALEEKLGEQQRQIARPILKELRDRLGFLVNVGLDYLTLSRQGNTLSGGESQRIRLASQIGAGLTGVLYVLDEPSIGLHQRDNKRLLSTLKSLRDQGNTVIVVEHDEEAIREADVVLDMGPGAGVHGGRVVVQGTPAEVESNPASLTGQYLCGRRSIPYNERRRPGNGHRIKVADAESNNLKKITVEFPLGKFICITGVSGSGKSTLVFDVLHRNLESLNLGGWHGRSVSGNFENCRLIEGTGSIRGVIDINQRPIGRTPRSNPATYTNSFTEIRDWFAGLPESRARGYKPGRFSFNVKGGRCEACGGDGVKRIAMHFLSDVYVTCESCHGARYNRETLEVLYKGKSIADVLDMTVQQALEFFDAMPKIRDKLAAMEAVGLGYIKLGQQATTLSGGEAQRVKLSKELARKASGKTLYILDEPTTGLHFEDIRRLLEVLHELVDRGNTVMVIEHNLDVIKTADWIVDMGPEGGDAGGTVVAAGTPEDISFNPDSHTGRFLRGALSLRRTEAA